MADAEWRDACDRGSLTDLCPILTALKHIDPRKSVSGMFVVTKLFLLLLLFLLFVVVVVVAPQGLQD